MAINQNPWGTMGSPTDQLAALKRRMLAGRSVNDGGDEGGGGNLGRQTFLRNAFGEEGAPDFRNVDIGGQMFTRLGGDPSTDFASRMAYKPFAQNVKYDPTYGWVIPQNLMYSPEAGYQYTGGGGFSDVFNRSLGQGPLAPLGITTGQTYLSGPLAGLQMAAGNEPGGPSIDTEKAAKIGAIGTLVGGAGAAAGLWGAGAGATAGGAGTTAATTAAPTLAAGGATAPSIMGTGTLGSGFSGAGLATGVGGTSLPALATATGTTGAGIGTALGAGVAPTAAAAGTSAVAGGGLWDTILKTITGGGSGTGGGGVTSPGTLAAGGLLQVISQLYAAGKYEDAAKLAAQLSDPFASQRPFYQGELHKLFTDPNYILNSPGYAAGMEAVNRRSAKLGQMFSGQNATDQVKYAQSQQMVLAGPLLQAAGAGISPGYAGYLAQSGANQATQARVGAAQAGATAMGGLYDIFKGSTQV